MFFIFRGDLLGEVNIEGKLDDGLTCEEVEAYLVILIPVFNNVSVDLGSLVRSLPRESWLVVDIVIRTLNGVLNGVFVHVIWRQQLKEALRTWLEHDVVRANIVVVLIALFDFQMLVAEIPEVEVVILDCRSSFVGDVDEDVIVAELLNIKLNVFLHSFLHINSEFIVILLVFIPHLAVPREAFGEMEEAHVSFQFLLAFKLESDCNFKNGILIANDTYIIFTDGYLFVAVFFEFDMINNTSRLL